MNALLLAATPAAWFEAAPQRLQELLLDHAACEKKAASNALAQIFAYPEETAACTVLARLAREELRHFEQVERLRQTLQLPFRRLRPSAYAGGMRGLLRTQEPQRRIDLLLFGAFVEARSHERFVGLLGALPEPAAKLYADLAESEARHCEVYLNLARAAAEQVGDTRFAAQQARLAIREAELITQPADEFRFHSGPPSAASV